MPIPTAITDLSTNPASNSPTGNENPIEGDNHLRTAYSFIRTLYNDSLPLIGEFGALGDGVTDDTAALQAALDSGAWFRLPRGKFRVTSELVWSNGSGIVGDDNSVMFWQFTANAPAVGEACEIYYDGAGGANSAVCRMSKQAVGTLPTFAADESNTLKDAGITGVVINGNNKAEFGLYSARAGLGCVYDNVCVTGTKERGFFFGEFWTCRVGALFAIHNYGSGGCFGEDLFSWSTGNIVNAVHAELLVAFKNGRDSGYDQVTAPKEGVGWILNWNRSCAVSVLIGELNYGPGLYVAPRTGPTYIEGLYLEDNCHFDPANDGASSTVSAYVDGNATQPWGMVGYNRETASGGDSVQLIVETLFAASPGSAPVRYQHVWLTGDTSGGFVAEPSEPWLFRSFYGVRGITSDFYNYSVEYPQQAIIDSSSTVDLDRCLPAVGIPESIVGSVSTLYVGNSASGNKSGRDASNLMTLDDAIRCARVCSGVSTIDMSARSSSSSPSTATTLDGRGFTRRLTISGGTTGRFNYSTGDNVAVYVKNWRVRLTFSGLAVLDRAVVTDASLEIDDCPLIRTGANSESRAAIVLDCASCMLNGTSVINVTNSTAATKICVALSGNSELSVNNAAAGTLLNYTAGNAIHFDEGSGTVRVSITTATAAWAAAASVARNAGGGAGMILAPNGLNP